MAHDPNLVSQILEINLKEKALTRILEHIVDLWHLYSITVLANARRNVNF